MLLCKVKILIVGNVIEIQPRFHCNLGLLSVSQTCMLLLLARYVCSEC